MITFVGVNNVSFQVASSNLEKLAGLKIPPKQIERLVKKIGRERVKKRKAKVAAHSHLPLNEKDENLNPNRPCPKVAMVSVDGGRIQIRKESSESERHENPSPNEAPSKVEARSRDYSPTPEPSASRDETPPRDGKTAGSSHWRETKVAVLETYQSDVSTSDPDPHVPRCFLDLKRATELVRGMDHPIPIGMNNLDKSDQSFASVPISAGADPNPPRPEIEWGFGVDDKSNENAHDMKNTLRVVVGSNDRECEPKRKGRDRKSRPGRPQRLVRSVLATRESVDEFGETVHQAACERNFFGAEHKAFLGDGMPSNWKIHARHFPSFRPILDFVHALSYVFAAAFAGRSNEEGKAIYARWIEAVWGGRVTSILPELERRSEELGTPPKECIAGDPRRLVADALRYLRNNADRMRYDEYRREGLPIVSCAVESAIKMINQRVKGSEKFWSSEGAEAILQLRADFLSETEVMDQFWEEREREATGTRPYETRVA